MNKVILTILLFVSLPVMATEYYVTTTGSDSNDGLAVDDAHAFLTPSHACSIVVPGDTVYIKGDGNQYTIDYNIVALCNVVDGTEGNEITIQAYDSSDRPLISWTPAYTGGWTSLGGNLWNSTSKVEVNNQDIQGLYKYDPTTGSVTILTKEFTSAAVDAEGEYFAFKGTTPAGKVRLYAAVDPNTYTGQWRFITGATGIDATGIKVGSYVNVKNINTIFNWQGFVAGGTTNESNILFEDCWANYAINRGFGLLSSGASTTLDKVTLRRVVVSNSLPSYTGYTIAPDQEGIKFGNGVLPTLATNLLIEDFLIYNMGYAGMQNTNSSSNVTIRNGKCYNMNLNVTNIDGACVRFGSSPATPQQNYEVSGMECYNARNCVTIYGDVSNVNVHNNYFHDYTQAGVYADTISGSSDFCTQGNCNVYNNLFINGAGSAVFMDESQNFTFYNNTIIGQADSAIRADDNSMYALSGTVKNNIVIGDAGANLMDIDESNIIVSDYNAFYSPDSTPFSFNGVSYNFTNYKSNSSQDTNSISTDFTTDFVDYAGGNYDIKNTASIKDLGVSLSGITNDYRYLQRPKGSASAIGAYEELESSYIGGIKINGVKLQ